MNKFELFTMTFYALDLYYDNNPSEELGQFLSSMSPFTFKEIGSAVQWVYNEFCEFVGEREITIDNSYNLAKEYVISLNNTLLLKAFCNTSEEKWEEGCNKYLATEHKGSNL